MAIVEARVRPEREASLARSASPGKRKRAERWWQYSAPAKELYRAIEGRQRVLAIARTSNSFAFTFLPSSAVFSENIIVFATDSLASFAVFQSRAHEAWARLVSNTLKDDLQYSPSICCETFPLPEAAAVQAALETSGRTYYEFRAALMIRNDEGLTKTYNRFHDPDERDSGILRMRDLHAAMDKAVLEVYGWSDIPTKCEFILDYEDDDEDEASGRRKPWRYRWPDDVRDEILARLLDLNAARAKEQQRAGAGAEAAKGGRRGRRRAPKAGKAGDWFA